MCSNEDIKKPSIQGEKYRWQNTLRENVLLISLLEQALLRQGLYRKLTVFLS